MEWLETVRSLFSQQVCFHSAPVLIGVADVRESVMGYLLPSWKRGMHGFPT